MFNLRKENELRRNERNALVDLIEQRVRIITKDLVAKAEEQVKVLADKDPETIKVREEQALVKTKIDELREQLKDSVYYIDYSMSNRSDRRSAELFKTNFPFEYKLSNNYFQDGNVNRFITLVEAKNETRLRKIEEVAQEIVSELRKLYTL